MTFAPNEEACVPGAEGVDGQRGHHHRLAARPTSTRRGVRSPVRGNVGMQVQHTDQSSTSFYWDASQPAGQNRVPFEDGKTYTDWLPSLNLAFSFDARPDAALRRGPPARTRRAWTRCVPRSSSASTPRPANPGGSRRQPAARSVEGQRVRHLVREVLRRHQGLRVGGVLLQGPAHLHLHRGPHATTSRSSSPTARQPGSRRRTTIGQFTAPYNGQGGKLQGLELTASLPLDMFWDAAEGLRFHRQRVVQRQQHHDPAGSGERRRAWVRRTSACRACRTRSTT